jgi:multiple sugar transport system substrate-binding protein
MKKRFAALLLASVVAVSSMAGCSLGQSNSSSAQASQKKTSSVKTKVVVWTQNRHDSKYMNQVVSDFNKSNSDVQIEYDIQTEDYNNLISMAAASKQMPDVMSEVDRDHTTQFANSKIIQPLDSFIQSDAEFQKVNEPSKHVYEGLNAVNEKIYWVPCGKRSGSRIIYNKEIFSKLNLQPAKTLDELVKDCKEITKAGNKKYYGIVIPGASGPFERWIEHSAEMSGVTPYDYKNGKYDFSGYKPFLKAVRQMFSDGSVFPGSASLKIDPSRVQFAEGKVAMEGNASQEATVFTEQFPAKMEWGVAQLPTLDGTIKGAESCSPNNGWMMSASTKDAQKAWKVISYFGSEKILKGYLEGGYTMPMSSYMEKAIDKSKTGRMADFSGAEYESVYPVAPSVTPEGQTYEDALWNACLPNGPDIDKTISQLNTNYNKALNEAISMGKVKRVVVSNYDPLHPDEGKVQYLDK